MVGTNHFDVIVFIEMNFETAHAFAKWALAKMNPSSVWLFAKFAANNGKLDRCRGHYSP
jgi:hypothetical protein